jgi:hypothetical protein
VQKVREAAARMSCTNNLKQIVLATHNYESAMGKLPPGVYGDPPTGGNPSFAYQYYGVLVPLLPYVEQNNVFNLFSASFNQNTTAPGTSWWGNGNAWTAAQYKIKMFLCPSDGGQDSATAGTMVLHWPVSCGPACGMMNGYDFPVSSVPANTLGKSNYVGVSGGIGQIGNGWDLWRGTFTTQSQNKIETITDGSSQTLFFGETLGGADTGTRDYAIAWMGAGQFSAAYGIPASGAQWNQFSSHHTGIVNFAYGDGAVRGIRKGCDTRTLMSAVGGFDGEVYDPSMIGN